MFYGYFQSGTHSSHLFDLNPNNTDDFIDLYRMFYDLRQYILEDTESYEVNDSVNVSDYYYYFTEILLALGFSGLQYMWWGWRMDKPMDFYNWNFKRL